MLTLMLSVCLNLVWKSN